MDISKLQQAIEDIRRHLASGDREAAIVRLRETMGLDHKTAALAIDQMADEPAALSQTGELNAEEVARQIRAILQAVPGGGMAGTLLRFAGLDLSKLAGTVTVESSGSRRSIHMALPTMTLKGTARGEAPAGASAAAPAEAPEPVAAPAAPPAQAPEERPRRASVLDRPHTRAVERTGRSGTVGFAFLLLVLAAAAVAAAVLLRHS